MLRCAILTAILAIVSLAPAKQAKMRLMQDGERIGSGLFVHEGTANGGSRLEITLTIQNGPQTIVMKQIDRYDAKARPIESVTIHQDGDQKTVRRHLFGPKALQISVTANSKTTSSLAAYPAGKSINRPSQKWFFDEMPLPGAISRETVFQNGKWTERISRYMGLKEILLNGKNVKAYELLDRRSDGTEEVRQWVDQDGMPLRMEFSASGTKLVLEREE